MSNTPNYYIDMKETLQEQRKNRIGRNDFKRNMRANRQNNRAILCVAAAAVLFLFSATLSADEGYGATAIMLRSHGGSFNQMFAKTIEGTAYFNLMNLAEDGTDTEATEAHVDGSWSFYLNMTYTAT